MPAITTKTARENVIWLASMVLTNWSKDDQQTRDRVFRMLYPYFSGCFGPQFAISTMQTIAAMLKKHDVNGLLPLFQTALRKAVHELKPLYADAAKKYVPANNFLFTDTGFERLADQIESVACQAEDCAKGRVTTDLENKTVTVSASWSVAARTVMNRRRIPFTETATEGGTTLTISDPQAAYKQAKALCDAASAKWNAVVNAAYGKDWGLDQQKGANR